MKILWAALLVLGGQDPEEGRRLLRDNRLEEARAVFERILAGSPQDAEALVGAGFTALRQHRLAEAQAYFRRALQAGSPVDADIPYGLALCHWRLGEVEAARRHLQEALKRDPRHGEARSLMGRLPEALRPVPPPPPRPAALQVPFRATAGGFQIREGSGWRTVFLKGVNLGAALPGHFATEFPGKAAYQGWLKEMGELGINVLRVYTIHPPAFYEALREHNLKAERPIHLLHGLWVEPPPGNDFEDPAWFGEWKEDMRRLVDLLHGRASFAPRPGFTGGNYRADVSPWWVGTILGREWEPFDVVAYDRKKPGLSDWRGRFLEVRQGTATEVFMAKAMDAFIAVEHDGYHIQRPLAFSNWPTLDPLEHPTETPYGEEQVLRKRLGLPYDPNPPHEVYDDDMVALDLEKYTALESYRGGLFASYHVYPNYPEFINLDPIYNRTLDPEGVNGFYGYLLDLRRHHRKHPVVVSEYGISNSRTPAHWQPQGMTHGGLDEKAQARMLQRLTRNIQDAGCAGAVVFAWMDEWFKKTWQVEPLERPPERGPLWFNALSAEENYGLIGHHPGRTGPSILIDGRRGDWDAVPAYQRGDGVELKLLADEGWLHVGVFWQGPRPDWASERFVLGIDTFDPALGNRRLPFGVPLRSAAGFEFAVNLSGEGCEVYVDAPYAFEPHRRARPTRSIAHEDGPWRIVESETNRLRVGRDGTVYPAHRYELGILHRGTQDREDPDFNSLAEWNEGEGFLEVRIPWTLLQVTDPSSHQVLQDPPDPPRGSPMGTLTTDGFRAALVRVRNAPRGRYEAVATLPAAQEGELPLPPLFTWKPWQQPTWHPFRKLAFGAVKEAFAALAETPQPPPPVRLQPLPPPPPPPEAVPEDLLEKARAARANRAWEEALAAYGALLAREPGQETAAVERAQTLAWAGRYREAAEAWKAVAERHPGRRAEADLQRAQVAAWGKDYLQAVAVLELYVRQGDRTALLDSARYLSWAGRFRASLALTEGWLARHPEDRQALAAHAQVLSWDGRLAESRAAYRRLLALGEAPEARLGLARVALWSGRFDEARAELDPLPEAIRATPEVQLLQAQLALGEGRRREAVATLWPLAVEGPGGDDARSLLRAAAENHGPSVELGFARTDSSDDLRMDETRLRARLPLGDGHVGLQAARHASSLEAPWALQRAADPSSLALFLVQPFGRWTLNAEAGRISGVGEAPASFHRIGLGYRLGPGLELSAAHGRSLVVATPEAASRRIAQQGFDLAFAWTGMADALNLQAGTAELSSGNRRVTWSATYGHRWRVSPFTLGAGATLRSLAYSESLPLGFWNPERYRFQGLTGSLLYTRNRFVFTGEAQGGRQSLAPGAWTRTWSCSLEARLGLGRSPFTLVGGWSASTAGLNAALPFEPTSYSERSFRFGLRVAGWGPGGSRR